AHVLELVLELDLLGDGDAVLGDRRRAPRLLDHDIAAARAERDFDGVGERVDAGLNAATSLLVENDFLGSHLQSPLRLDDAEDFVLAHDDVFHAVDLDLGPGVLAEQDAVARLDVELEQSAVLQALARADGDDLALERTLFGRVGDDDAAAGLLDLFDA